MSLSLDNPGMVAQRKELSDSIVPFIESGLERNIENLLRDSSFSEEKYPRRKHYEEFLYIARALTDRNFQIETFPSYKEGFMEIRRTIDKIIDHNNFLVHWIDDLGEYLDGSGHRIETKAEEFNRYFGIKVLAEKRFGITAEKVDSFREKFDAVYDAIFNQRYGIAFTEYMLSPPLKQSNGKKAA